MPAYKDETRNNWYCAFYFEDWNGERKKKMKRGFETKKAAQDWERQFLLQRAAVSREADRPTSGEAIWLARRVAATRQSRGAAESGHAL